MSNKDARARMFDSIMKTAEQKWEFRYENQDKRIKKLEATVKRQREKIKELKKTA